MSAARTASVHIPEVAGHPNRVEFEGCLALVGVVSEKKIGLRDWRSELQPHRGVLTYRAAIEALPSLLGMAVNFKTGFSGHGPRQKCGIITAAEVRDRQLLVRGFVWALDFPELIADEAQTPELGMSFEVEKTHVLDIRADIWVMVKTMFTGASILLRSRAAYSGTWFRILRRAENQVTFAAESIAA